MYLYVLLYAMQPWMYKHKLYSYTYSVCPAISFYLNAKSSLSLSNSYRISVFIGFNFLILEKHMCFILSTFFSGIRNFYFILFSEVTVLARA